MLLASCFLEQLPVLYNSGLRRYLKDSLSEFINRLPEADTVV